MNKVRQTSSTSRTAYIVCPFFRSHGDRCIKCEGIIPGVMDTHVFDTVESKRAQERIYCEDKWKYCEYASAILTEKYADEE